jgi:hypothetical protein
MEDLVDEVGATVESGGNVSEDKIVRLLENARELPNQSAKRAYGTVLEHHSELDSPLTGEQLLDLYEIRTYANQRGLLGIRTRSETLAEEAEPEKPRTPAREVDTTEVEEMTVSQARENLSQYRDGKQPVEEHGELVEGSTKRYVADFDGRIRPD